MNRQTSFLRIAGLCLATLWLLAAGEAWAGDGTDASRTSRIPEVNAGELETLVVTATRTPMAVSDLPVSVTVIKRQQIARSASQTLDELLRSVPSFNLFRRSSSLAADPSSQGVKLRNVGGSAVSRALVLVDGIPANDAYAGWVAWRSIPRIGIERIELVPSGSSALYGNYALGGVIQVLSRPIEPRTLEAIADYGSFDSYTISVHAADRAGPVGASVDAETLQSDGYPVVAHYDRGRIDGDTTSRHQTLDGRLQVDPSPQFGFGLEAGYFNEDFNGGTRYTTASVDRLGFSGSAHFLPENAGRIEATLFGHNAEFQQDRARVGPGRNTETLSAHQEVPADDLGGSVLWFTPTLQFHGAHTITVGADARWIDGKTRETLYPATTPPSGNPTVQRNATGKQDLHGVFIQDVYDYSSAVNASLALRYDHWQNLSGERAEIAYDREVTDTRFPDRSESQFSPKFAVRVRLNDWLDVRGAAYHAFRAPTLDELYRPFQVGTVRTDSNPALVAEALRGVEAGVDVGGTRAISARLTGFWNELDNPIVNVSTGPNTRQKQNLGSARISGIEFEGRWTFAPEWFVHAAYTYAPTEVTSAPGRSQLLGKELPETPRNMATLSLTYDDTQRGTAEVTVRYLGKQYENDINTLPMSDVAITDCYAAWHATPQLDLYLGVKNLFDQTYLVGRAGVDTIGQPRFVHGGVRLRLEP